MNLSWIRPYKSALGLIPLTRLFSLVEHRVRRFSANQGLFSMRSRGFHPPACVTLFPTHAEEFLFAAALGLACLPAFAVSSPWIEVRSPHFTAEEVLESQHNTDGAPMVLNEGRPTSTTPRPARRDRQPDRPPPAHPGSQPQSRAIPKRRRVHTKVTKRCRRTAREALSGHGFSVPESTRATGL